MNQNTKPQVDLTNCDREPIHLLGKVQRFGFLVALTSDWIVSHISANASEYLGGEPESLIGEAATTFLSRESIHSIRNKLQNMRSGALPEIVHNVSVGLGDKSLYDATVHIASNHIVLEFERPSADGSAERYVGDVQQAMNRIARLNDVTGILKFAVRFAAALTGFDRVMAYRFAPDQSGEVVAEWHASGLKPFLGLRYPASDIPAQARTLYVKNPIRVIADTYDDGVEILPGPGPDGVLDLSNSILRSVSSIHLEYLRNMPVGASMSISLIIEGKLWGLIACHHRRSKILPQAQRNAILLFGQMLSLLLEGRLSRDDTAALESTSELINAVSRSAAASSSVNELFAANYESALALMQADGMAVLANGAVTGVGLRPSNEDVRAIAKRLNTLPAGQVFATNEIRTLLPEATAYKEDAAGLVAIPISKAPRDYVIFFRPELKRVVTWAGDPEKPAQLGPNGIRLTPRKSFEAWREEVEGQSEEWSRTQIKAAEQLRITMLEVVLRMADEAAEERRKASEKQELLIAELNHRVRNILGLVRSLISQTSATDISTAEFAKVLDSRIHALARAHDQITKENWLPAPVKQLIRTEAAGYLLDKSDRVIIEGDEVMLTPTAYSTVALVVHELMTNSAKYGALADRSGTVRVNLTRLPDGALDLFWTEMDGPPVTKPTRRGFGTTIIERSIPFELQGESEIDYPVTGVKARIRIPATHVREGDPMPESVFEEPASNDVDHEMPAIPQHALLAEDNLIIAMDAEDILRSMGFARVTACGTVSTGLMALDEGSVDFAVLDINLGADLSIPIAEKLHEAGTPFIFASGYGENAVMPEHLSDVPILAKPYDFEGMRKAVAIALERAKAD
ncbi:HWE histidine kinase domain-containing protein [Oricola sp.]|uniref:HWE histidine kinase domain-containing protein n=1 Tax=Oricola sp. TaxID=1979950 RepID=UPI0025EBCF0A|nr:HWE histidine kinase domain-containing protein [Oricola sp.]MCI5077193.1 GAF domain-containing protein [Oricola sp.]